MQSYGMIAAELTGDSRIETSDSAAQIKLVKERLEQWGEAWLLVFDNYDEPERFPDIRKFIPTSRRNSVVDGRSVADHEIRGIWSRTVHQPQSKSQPARHASQYSTDGNGGRRKTFAACLQRQ